MEDIPRKRNPLCCKGWKTFSIFIQENEKFWHQVNKSILRKLKAQRLRWTTAWRRLHKKIKQSDQGKLKKKRVFKQERAIEGVSLESIKKLKHAKPEDKKALAE